MWLGEAVVSYPKGPEAKDDDDKVNDISEEHQGVDICGGPVFILGYTPKETLSRLLHILEPAEKNTTCLLFTVS